MGGESGLIIRCVGIPIDCKRIEQLPGYIVRGLLFHHWGVALGHVCSVEVYSLTPIGERMLDRYLAPSALRYAETNIADGALAYRGVQAEDHPQTSVWQISPYGMKTVGTGSLVASSKFGAMTGLAEVMERIERLAVNGMHSSK